MNDLYYTAPSDEVFEEIRLACIKRWNTFDNEFGYVDEKVGQVTMLTNVRDNWMYMLAMFDNWQRMVVLGTLSASTYRLVTAAMGSTE